MFIQLNKKFLKLWSSVYYTKRDNKFILTFRRNVLPVYSDVSEKSAACLFRATEFVSGPCWSVNVRTGYFTQKCRLPHKL